MHPISISIPLLLLLLLSLSLSVLGTPTPAALDLDLKTTNPGGLLANFNSSCDIICQTDSILFDYSLAEFLIARSSSSTNTTNTKQLAYLDWSSDGCTTAPDFPKGYNFQDSCYRHDFGYRNYRNQARLHLADNRKRIDKKLKRDCNDECTTHYLNGAEEMVLKWLECRRIAQLYYVAVRLFGKGQAKAKGGGAGGVEGG